MTKEEAIELLEKIDVKFFLSGMMEQIDCFVDKAEEVNVAIETVLSLIEEKDKQIDKLKKHNNDLLRKLRSRVKQVKKLEKYSLYKQEFSNLNKQLKSKDKIIDLISEQLTTPIHSKEWVKEYYERKAKEVK